MSISSHPFTTLTPDLVMDAVESVGYRCDARILQLNSYENRVYQIGVEDGEPLIGKFYRPDHWTDQQILEEHVFTQDLFDDDVSAVPPLQIRGAATLTEFGGFRFALYPRRGGRASERLGRHRAVAALLGHDGARAGRRAACLTDGDVRVFSCDEPSCVVRSFARLSSVLFRVPRASV